MSFAEESPPIDTPHNETSPISKNKGGKPGWFGWGKYAKKLEEVGPSRWCAECLSCHIVWPKGSPQEIEVHLAFECQKVEPSVRDIFLQRLASKAVNQDSTETNIYKKRKRDDGTTRQRKITEFENTEDQINHALVKAFVICGIPWHVIENPFFIEFLKTLRSSYQPPSRETLSGKFLAQEAAVVNQQVIKDLTTQQNLTLCKLFFIHLYKLFLLLISFV